MMGSVLHLTARAKSYGNGLRVFSPVLVCLFQFFFKTIATLFNIKKSVGPSS